MRDPNIIGHGCWIVPQGPIWLGREAGSTDSENPSTKAPPGPQHLNGAGKERLPQSRNGWPDVAGTTRDLSEIYV
jgi:hypothetical protein